MNQPTHPGRPAIDAESAQAQQGGLMPQPAEPNPYFVPNATLATASAQQGAQLGEAQAMQARAAADKALAERDIMAAGLGNVQAPMAMPPAAIPQDPALMTPPQGLGAF